MKFIKKYDYTSLKRQDGEYRIYLTPDGESLPSVTSVLSKTKDKTGLHAWRKRVGEKKAEKIMEDAARIGTALHVYICLLYTSPSPRD